MESRKKLFEELNREIEYYSSHTQRQYRSHLSDYLDFVGPNRDWRDRDVLYNYTKKLKSQGRQQQTVNYIIRGPIGALFRAYGLRIPVKLPRVKISGLVHDLASMIQFTPGDIAAFIKAARGMDKSHRAIMAIATTYGPRAGEIQSIQPADVREKKDTIVLKPSKYGLMREHLVPPQIQAYVFGYNYPSYSHNQLYQLFNEVSKEAGVQRVSRKAYHAIRHGLCNEMMYGSKIPPADVYLFLRWRGAGMLATYAPFHPDNDETCFAKHPFLDFWVK